MGPTHIADFLAILHRFQDRDDLLFGKPSLFHTEFSLLFLDLLCDLN